MSTMSKNADQVMKKLEKQADAVSKMHLKDLYDEDGERFEKFSVHANNIFLDISKQRISAEIIKNLCEWADSRDVRGFLINTMEGKIVNTTEGRQALHSVLRATDEIKRQTLTAEQYNEVVETDRRMKQLSEDVDKGNIRGEDNKHFTDIIVTGIGGSILGTKFVYEALSLHHKVEIDLHFVSSLNDGSLSRTLLNLDPESTLMIAISKTFTTQETLQNSSEIIEWFRSSGISQENIGRHILAVTADVDKALSYGYEREMIYPIWDWVGGRFSLWSAVGLPIVLGLGWDAFEELRRGAHKMDTHAVTAEYEQNIPVLMALVSVWNREFLGSTSVAVLPYGDNLRSFPDYLQQLEMESNGKEITVNGTKAVVSPSSIVWGREGSNAQHSFMQRVHQCHDTVPAEFIIGIPDKPVSPKALSLLVANCIAQSEALMVGRPAEQAYQDMIEEGHDETYAKMMSAHKHMPGNNQSTTLVLDSFSPECLGSLLSLYENKTISESRLMDTNPFDQWGVELGKRICREIEKYINCESEVPASSPSKGLVGYIVKLIKKENN